MTHSTRTDSTRTWKTQVGTSLSAWLLLGALALSSACSHKKTEAEQLGDLDKAYQSGAVTKQEYDAKKAAITGQPAPAPAATPAPAPAAAESSTPPATPAAANNPSTPSTPAEEADTEPPAPSKSCQDAEFRTRKDPGPQTRFYPVPLAQAKQAALDAFQTLNFTVRSQTDTEIDAQRKKTKKGAVVGAGGERVTLTLEAATQDGKAGTQVTSSTKKGKLPTQKSWTDAVLAEIACDLKL